MTILEHQLIKRKLRNYLISSEGESSSRSQSVGLLDGVPIYIFKDASGDVRVVKWRVHEGIEECSILCRDLKSLDNLVTSLRTTKVNDENGEEKNENKVSGKDEEEEDGEKDEEKDEDKNKEKDSRKALLQVLEGVLKQLKEDKIKDLKAPALGPGILSEETMLLESNRTLQPSASSQQALASGTDEGIATSHDGCTSLAGGSVHIDSTTLHGQPVSDAHEAGLHSTTSLPSLGNHRLSSTLFNHAFYDPCASPSSDEPDSDNKDPSFTLDPNDVESDEDHVIPLFDDADVTHSSCAKKNTSKKAKPRARTATESEKVSVKPQEMQQLIRQGIRKYFKQKKPKKPLNKPVKCWSLGAQERRTAGAVCRTSVKRRGVVPEPSNTFVPLRQNYLNNREGVMVAIGGGELMAPKRGDIIVPRRSGEVMNPKRGREGVMRGMRSGGVVRGMRGGGVMKSMRGSGEIRFMRSEERVIRDDVIPAMNNKEATAPNHDREGLMMYASAANEVKHTWGHVYGGVNEEGCYSSRLKQPLQLDYVDESYESYDDQECTDDAEWQEDFCNEEYYQDDYAEESQYEAYEESYEDEEDFGWSGEYEGELSQRDNGEVIECESDDGDDCFVVELVE